MTTTGDAVLIASYPAGFLGGATLQKDLWPAATTVAIQKVFTFVRTTIDVLSLGGSIVAQAGASGGAVMNEWGQLVGLVSTSSLGDTTDERDLRAITVSHIDTSVTEQTGSSLLSWLQQGDFQNRLETFNQNSVPYLLTEFPL